MVPNVSLLWPKDPFMTELVCADVSSAVISRVIFILSL